MIDISKYNKADVFRALYNNARPLGMGFLQHVPGDMSREDAQAYIDNATLQDHGGFPCSDGRRLYFDYVNGRCLKVDLSGDTLNPALYDRDWGPGAAQRVIEAECQLA